MIRIKNISRENIGVRRQNAGVRLPNGRIAQVRQGKVIAIDYETYKLNRLIIALPNERMGMNTCYRVVSGAEEILGKGAPPVAGEPIEPENEKHTPPETPEPEKPGLEEQTDKPSEASENEPEKEEAITLVPEETITEEKPDDESESNEGGEETETTERAPLYTQSKLGKMAHAQLNELLTKHGIVVPEGALKSEKIDALLKLNG